MIRRSPVVTVSQGGAVVAIGFDGQVTIVDAVSGDVRSIAGPTSSAVVALAPTRADAAVAASDTSLTWLDGDPPGPTVSLPGRAMLARVGDDGVVAVVTRSDASGTHLVVCAGAALQPVIDPVLLGLVSTWGIELDGPSSSAVLWGMLGPRAWEGDGKPYVRQVAWGGGQAEIGWTGGGLPAGVELIRTGGGRLVAAAADRIVTSTLAALVADGRLDGREVAAPDDVDQLAISPNGESLAFITTDGTRSHLRSACLEDGATADRGRIPDGLRVSAVAIDDGGRIVVCGTREAGTVVGAVAPTDESLAEAWTVELPRSIHRRDD